MGKQNDNNYQIEKIIDELNGHMYHPILNRDLGQPKLNEQTALFLLLPKLNGEEWTSSTQTAAIAVGAVYTAFDAHDALDVYDVTTTKEQLRVLAGDYYSGLYYQLLATIPHFEFIGVLSKTIGRINEVKTEFHTNKELTNADRIEAVTTIQVECISQFYTMFGYEKYLPVVKAALPLLAFTKHGTLPAGWTLKDEQSAKTLQQLRMNMEKVISEAVFLNPQLADDVMEMTLPLLNKTT